LGRRAKSGGGRGIRNAPRERGLLGTLEESLTGPFFAGGQVVSHKRGGLGEKEEKKRAGGNRRMTESDAVERNGQKRSIIIGS